MKYARVHIKRFWDFAYMRAIGTSLLTLALLVAVGYIFTTSLGEVLGPYYSNIYLSFWAMIFAVIIFVFATNFASAHIMSAKYMTRKEYKQHSAYMAVWILALVVGCIAFALPFLLVSNLSVIMLLFSFGGMLLVAYLSAGVLFKFYYHEMALGVAVLWAIFIIVYYNPGNLIAVYLMQTQLILALSIITIVVVSGFVGLMLIFDSSRKFIKDFEENL